MALIELLDLDQLNVLFESNVRAQVAKRNAASHSRGSSRLGQTFRRQRLASGQTSPRRFVCEQGSTAHADDQSELAAIENCTGQITMRPFTKEGEPTMATRRSKKKLTKKKPSKKQPRAATTALPAGVTSDDEDWEVKEARWRSILVNQAKRAIALRSLDREFHGLEREFRDHQAQMLIDYERTKDLKHPRDLGDTRECVFRSS